MNNEVKEGLLRTGVPPLWREVSNLASACSKPEQVSSFNSSNSWRSDAVCLPTHGRRSLGNSHSMSPAALLATLVCVVAAGIQGGAPVGCASLPVSSSVSLPATLSTARPPAARHLPAAAAQPLGGVANTKHLKRAIYTELRQGDACVRLLHASGSVGCAAPGREDVEGMLLRLTELGDAGTYPGIANGCWLARGRSAWATREAVLSLPQRGVYASWQLH